MNLEIIKYCSFHPSNQQRSEHLLFEAPVLEPGWAGVVEGQPNIYPPGWRETTGKVQRGPGWVGHPASGVESLVGINKVPTMFYLLDRPHLFILKAVSILPCRAFSPLAWVVLFPFETVSQHLTYSVVIFILSGISYHRAPAVGGALNSVTVGGAGLVWRWWFESLSAPEETPPPPPYLFLKSVLEHGSCRVNICGLKFSNCVLRMQGPGNSLVIQWVRTLCFHYRGHGFDPWSGN